MIQKKKLFVVSDLHGHYALLKDILDQAGFDSDNKDHLFICCGDLFDRGTENRAVYDFVRKLKNKVLIKGNHDERLLEIIEQKRLTVYDIHNGIAPTLEEFFGQDSIGDYGDLLLPKHGKMASTIRKFISGMVDYYETENYVFVHGWLPTQSGVNPPILVEDWRNASAAEWKSSRFSEWTALYKTPAMLPGKTIICGHRPTRLAIKIDPSRSPADSSIFRGEGMIAIDAGTIRSGKMNLLVLEDNVYIPDGE